MGSEQVAVGVWGHRNQRKGLIFSWASLISDLNFCGKSAAEICSDRISQENVFGVEVGVVFGMGHFTGLLIVLGGVMPAALHVQCKML